MKFGKTLIALAATVSGAGVLATAPVLSAAEYTSSVSGNIRVEALSTTEEIKADNSATDDVDESERGPVLTTTFGGDEEESKTGGDTYLQWNHGFENDDGTTTGKGFIRFAGDGTIRINVEASSQVGNYKGDLKAEWERNGFSGTVCTGSAARTGTDAAGNAVSGFSDGCTTSIAERDQFAKLTHTGIGLYYKIGREEWFGNQKGYGTDFVSQSKGLADGAGKANVNGRVSGHALGWTGSGLDVALFIQRDNAASTSGKLVQGARSGARATAVSGFGLLLGYAAGPVDLRLNFVSSSASSDIVDDTSSLTELQAVFPLGAFKPFLNFGSVALTEKDKGANAATVTEATASGFNLGLGYNFGASELVVAFGSGSSEDTATTDGKTDTTGIDLMWHTTQEPLKVSLAFNTGSGEITGATPAINNKKTSTTVYGVRLDFGF